MDILQKIYNFLYERKDLNIVLQKMKTSPTDYTINDLIKISDQKNIKYKKASGSHVVFKGKNTSLSVPNSPKIDPRYIKLFVKFILEN
jgi:hypothetical protein